MEPNGTGIYVIINEKTQGFYIGSSVDIGRRHAEHIKSLRSNSHHCYLLQNDFNLFGEGSFSIGVLMRTRLIDLQNIEEILIQTLDPIYNIARYVSPVKYGKKTRGRNEDINYSIEFEGLKKLFPSTSPSLLRRLTEACTVIDTQLSLWE